MLPFQLPINFLKRLKRKYNQSELLAQEFEKLSNIPLRTKNLDKIKTYNTMGGRYFEKKRLRNINGSFNVNPQFSHLLKGKTTNECSKILKKTQNIKKNNSSNSC
jgi:predicted amidophosphoribosyltransferase